MEGIRARALILGVTSGQVDAIRFLKEAGAEVIGAAHKKRGAGLPHLNRFELVDIADPDAIEAVATQVGADLVYSVGSDLGIETSSEASKSLGLPFFVEPSRIREIHDKARLRGTLNRLAIGRVDYARVGQEEDLDGWGTYPAVLKPVDRWGARGVFKIHDAQEARKRLPRALEHSRKGQALIEPHLEGPEVSVHLYRVNGETRFWLLSDRIPRTGTEGFGVPQAHVVPSQRIDGEAKRQTLEQAQAAVDALDLRNGPVYIQTRFTEAGPRILEITPRLDGCHLWRAIDASCGVNLLECVFHHLLAGDPGELETARSVLHRLEFHLGPAEGPFTRHEYPVEPGVYQEFYYDAGERVRSTNGMRERVGYRLRRLER